MGGINAARVVMAGLVAGLVINVGEFIANMWVFRGAMQDMMDRFNLSEPSGAAMAAFIVLAFVGGVVLVWLYAAIRPRYGAGAQTAAVAAMAMWFLAYVWPTVGWVAMGMLQTGVALMALGWGLLEIGAAAMVGGWLYQEPAAMT